jgi:hypothetical protein
MRLAECSSVVLKSSTYLRPLPGGRGLGGPPRREYTEALWEVAMDKPRHPQVIRPWKTQQTQKNKWNAPPTTEPRRERGKKSFTPKQN